MIGDMPLEEDLMQRRPPCLEEWVRERLANCKRIAAEKQGIERDGWLEDVRYFSEILDLVLKFGTRSDLIVRASRKQRGTGHD